MLVPLDAEDGSDSSCISVDQGCQFKEAPRVVQRSRKTTRRCVSFNDEARMIHEIECLVKEESLKHMLWFSARDYASIIRINKAIVKCARVGKFTESNMHTYRGLEGQNMASRQFVSQTVRAVLNEQGRQALLREKLPDLLAMKYESLSRKSKEDAVMRAQQDAQAHDQRCCPHHC